MADFLWSKRSTMKRQRPEECIVRVFRQLPVVQKVNSGSSQLTSSSLGWTLDTPLSQETIFIYCFCIIKANKNVLGFTYSVGFHWVLHWIVMLSIGSSTAMEHFPLEFLVVHCLLGLIRLETCLQCINGCTESSTNAYWVASSLA